MLHSLNSQLTYDSVYCTLKVHDNPPSPNSINLYIIGNKCNTYIHNYAVPFNRGESKTVQKGEVMAHAWKDNKVVSVMNTNTQPTATGTVLRRKKDGTRVSVSCPKSVISSTMSVWVQLIVVISYVATTAAARRVASFTATFTISVWT